MGTLAETLINEKKKLISTLNIPEDIKRDLIIELDIIKNAVIPDVRSYHLYFYMKKLISLEHLYQDVKRLMFKDYEIDAILSNE